MTHPNLYDSFRRSGRAAIVACLLGAALHAASASAQEPATSAVPTPGVPSSDLVIATKHIPPFAYQVDGRWEGISISLWRRIAEDLGLTYRFVEEPGVEETLDGLIADRFDVVAGALTVTAARERRIDFTHAFYSSGQGVAVRAATGGGVLALLRQLLSWDFLQVFLGLAVLLGLVGLLAWLLERRSNREQFGGTPLEGIGNGVWWAAVTMTTVGYGDKAPRTRGGRVLGLVWMFLSLAILGGFVAAFASALTLGSLSRDVASVEDLPSVRVGVVEGTTGAEHAVGEGYRLRLYPGVEEALGGLAAGEVSAVIYDRPILAHRLRTASQRGDTPYADCLLLESRVTWEAYAFGLRTGSPLREPINNSLLGLLRGEATQRLFQSHLGR